MKRIFITALAAAAVLCLCACGAADEPERVPLTPVEVHQTAEPASGSEADTPPQEAPASETDIAEPPAAEAPVEEEEEDASAREKQARFEQAEALIGHPAQELFDILGEPESSQYASSCEVDGGEEGMQFYDGFYVWTLRTAEEETVRAVYLDE